MAAPAVHTIRAHASLKSNLQPIRSKKNFVSASMSALAIFCYGAF